MKTHQLSFDPPPCPLRPLLSAPKSAISNQQSPIINQRMFSFLCTFLLCAVSAPAAPSVSFQQSFSRVERYDFIEVTLKVVRPPAGNPFTEAAVTGEFAPEGGPPLKVDGFCDSGDESIFRIRFMPSQAGKYNYTEDWVLLLEPGKGQD